MNLFGGPETRTATECDPLDESFDTEYPTSWEQYQRDDREWPYDVVPKNPDEHEDAGSDLTNDDVGPVVAQVSDRIDGLTHNQAVETVTVLLDVKLGDDGASDETPSESGTDPDEALSEAATATSDTASAGPTDDQPTEDDATATSTASTDDSSSSEMDLEPAIVPVEEGGEDESTPEREP